MVEGKEESASQHLALQYSPRLVDSSLPGWEMTVLDDGILLTPIDSPPPTPESARREVVPKKAKRYFFAGPLPKCVPMHRPAPGPGQYHTTSTDSSGSRWSFGYCPNRKHLSGKRGGNTWIPSTQDDTPGCTYTEKIKPRGFTIGLRRDPAAETTTSMDRQFNLSWPLGQDNPFGPSQPSWGWHKHENSFGTQEVPPAPVELSKPRRIGDNVPEFSFGKRPDSLRLSSTDWTASQTSLSVGPGLKFNHQTATTRHGQQRQLGSTMGARVGSGQFSKATAAQDVPSMYLLDKFNGRTVRSDSDQGRRFPTVPRFGHYY